LNNLSLLTFRVVEKVERIRNSLGFESLLVGGEAAARMKKLLLRRDYAGKHKNRMEK